ncbi:MAG: VWA domain-containing protein [Elusimicrobiaceae bacterium]|nr:VWA domain-containing protein [Elusimicrobiaceae bacterium]
MKFNEQDLQNKFSALDFDPQNIRQNRIYSKLKARTDERRYAMKKFIYAFGTVCLIGLLLVPVVIKKGQIENPQIKFPPDTSAFVKDLAQSDKTAVKENTETPAEKIAPAFLKDATKEDVTEKETAAPSADGLAMDLEASNSFQASQIEAQKMRKMEESRRIDQEERMAYPYGRALGSARMSAPAAAPAGFSSKAGAFDGGRMAAAGGSRGGSVWSYPRNSYQGSYYPSSSSYNDMNSETYNSFEGNDFKIVKQEPLSTFSADVDTASYNIVRRDITRGALPRKDAVRTEEFINYFTYDYAAPKASGKDPVKFIPELTDSPWHEGFQVVKIGVKAKDIDREKLPPSNLVFLIDVSGSMASNNRLPLIKQAFGMLVEKLRPQDKVSIVTYANNTNIVLDGVSLADEDGKQQIINAMEGLYAGGGTYGSDGLEKAYQVAKKHFIKKGNNRIILATDGDFNIGNTSLGGLEKQITEAKESGVFLSVLGFGMGNYKDATVQTLADKGNGNYAYINDLFEAKKALVKDFGSTLFTVAKDVKFQVEFNPAKVQAYRLIGYEKRKLNNQDFNDDTKDAGELGAGHTVTVLYEIIPVGVKIPEGLPTIDDLKYSVTEKQTATRSDELLTVKLRYKEPDGDKSKLMSEVLKKSDYKPFEKTTDDTRFALSVAAFAELLKDNRYSKDVDIDKIIEVARKAKGEDADGYRADFVKIMSLYQALPKVKERVENMQGKDI